MAYFLVPDAILFDFAHFSEIQPVCDGPRDLQTHRRTDGPTHGRTDTPSYRDARMHLKILEVDFLFKNIYKIQIMYPLFYRKKFIPVLFKENNSENSISDWFFPLNEPEHDLNVFLNFGQKTSLMSI